MQNAVKMSTDFLRHSHTWKVTLSQPFTGSSRRGVTVSLHNRNKNHLFIRALYISLIIFFALKRIIFVLAMVSPIISLISS